MKSRSLGSVDTNREVIELQALGLTERESKVYLWLVRSGGASATELPAFAKIPRSKVYETLERLLSLGLIYEKPIGKHKRYQAVRPDNAIRHLLLQQEEALDARKRAGDHLIFRLESIFSNTHNEVNPYDYFTVMKNPKQVTSAWLRLQQEAQTELCVFNKAPYTSTNRVNEVQLAAMKRGVVYRGIYEESETMDDERLERMKLYADAGEQLRIHPNLAIKMVVFDRKKAFFQITDPHYPDHRSTMLIEHPGIATAFQLCFERCWEEAIDLREFIKRRREV